MHKKAVEQSAVSKNLTEISKGAQGVGGNAILEPVPNFIATQCEQVIKNKNNAWIVLGRDRPGNRMSGFGGRGDTQCASIDLVAGRMGFEAKMVDESGAAIWTDPDIERDAARVYISQKTNIDENYGLVDGTVGNAKIRSGIALKADGIRIVAREGIKLVTGTDEKNSQGGNIKTTTGIDLIAGNYGDDIQPLVKGDNMAEALDSVIGYIDKLTGIVDSFLMAQVELNSVLMAHTHVTSLGPTTPSIELIPATMKAIMNELIQTKFSIYTHKMNLGSAKIKYTTPAGRKYINSRWNNTN